MTQERTHDEGIRTGPQPQSDPFAAATAVLEPQVEVVYGVYAHSYPLVGLTVGAARAELAERMNIAPTAGAIVDGVAVSDATVLREGQILEFMKEAGEKGGPIHGPRRSNQIKKS